MFYWKELFRASKKKFDELANSSAMIVIKINGLYDCERDSVEVCENISNYLYQSQSPKAAVPFEDN